VKANNLMFSDDEIIKSVKIGKTQNFEIIINKYNKKILNFINRMIFDYDESQNISQDVFLKVYENLNRYKMEGNFQAFIFKIAKNLTLNYIKKKKRVLFFSEHFSNGIEGKHFQYEATQYKSIEEKVKEELLISSIMELKENQKIALILKIYLDFSYKNISKITGWSIPKIETLISRAKNTLKRKIFLQENKDKNVYKVREK
jgi:RNA polymerase sigma-70 factor (ECF subfamily)